MKIKKDAQVSAHLGVSFGGLIRKWRTGGLWPYFRRVRR